MEVMKPILISARAAWENPRHKLAAKRAAPILERRFDIKTSLMERSRQRDPSCFCCVSLDQDAPDWEEFLRLRLSAKTRR
jgi:hypothetical protein